MKLPGEIGLGSGIVASTQRTRKAFSGGRRDVHTRGDLQQLMCVTTQFRRCHWRRTHDAHQSKSFVKVAPSALILVIPAVKSHNSVPIAAKRPLAHT
jgi:hypothetical protein